MTDKELILMMRTVLHRLTGMPEVYTSERVYQFIIQTIDKVDDEQAKQG
jgi:hypothetical protein